MGYDQVAYLDVDQEDVARFIAENSLDPVENDDDEKRICAEFGDRVGLLELEWMYSVNERCGIHEFCCYHHSSFIRDDERFENRRFQKHLCQKLMKDVFPSCLKNICWELRTREDALEIACALDVFFFDDKNLAQFAEWLRQTATCCSTYQLSS